MTIIITILLCGLTLATGCAKKDLIKADESAISPAAPATDLVSAAKPPATEGGVAEERVAEAAVMGEPADANENASRAESRLETVYFDFDSHILSPEARDGLFRNSRWLKENPSVKVQIEGHTDERGSDSYNIALGEKRAKSALQYLLTMGITAERLSVISYGEEKPAEAGNSEDAWAKNRRAEFVTSR